MVERGEVVEIDADEAARRVAAGEVEAFASLVERTTPALFRLAARMMGNAVDAEDVLQDSYHRAFDALVGGEFRAESGVASWLYRIVANTALNALRSTKRRRATVDVDSIELEDPDAAGDARAALAELGRMLDELPALERSAIVLKEIEGRTSREIAELLGCSEGAVEQRLVRARAALRAKGAS